MYSFQKRQEPNARTEAANERANQYQKTQVALITSRPVLRAVLKDEQIRRLALIQKQGDRGEASQIDWLEHELKAELVLNTDLLRLELSSREHPEELKKIVEAVQNAYMKDSAALKIPL